MPKLTEEHWVVETWPDGRVSITAEGGSGDVVAWMEPGMERFASLIASAPGNEKGVK